MAWISKDSCQFIVYHPARADPAGDTNSSTPLRLAEGKLFFLSHPLEESRGDGAKEKTSLTLALSQRERGCRVGLSGQPEGRTATRIEESVDISRLNLDPDFFD